MRVRPARSILQGRPRSTTWAPLEPRASFRVPPLAATLPALPALFKAFHWYHCNVTVSQLRSRPRGHDLAGTTRPSDLIYYWTILYRGVSFLSCSFFYIIDSLTNFASLFFRAVGVEVAATLRLFFRLESDFGGIRGVGGRSPRPYVLMQSVGLSLLRVDQAWNK